MKLATWNVNSLTVRLPQLLDWLALNQPDVVVLQETKLTDDKFPHAELAAAGWHCAWFGQKTYNGVALLARSEPTAIIKNIPGFEDAQARVIAGTVGELRVIGAYFPNGQAPGSDKFAYKMAWLSALRGWLQNELAAHSNLVLMGDYNIAPDDRDVFDPVAWAGQIHCTDEERAHFQGLVGLGLVDTFRMFEQAPRLWSWWDYRNLRFARIRACALTTSWSARPWSLRCRPATSTSCRARTSDPAITHRWWCNLRSPLFHPPPRDAWHDFAPRQPRRAARQPKSEPCICQR